MSVDDEPFWLTATPHWLTGTSETPLNMPDVDPFWLTPESARHVNPNKPVGEDEVVEMATAGMGEDYIVLDYGCGTGRLAARFLPKHYLGLDASYARIAKARIVASSHWFEQMPDIEALARLDGEPFPRLKCTIVFDNVLLHMPDDSAARALEIVTSEKLGIRRIVIAEHMDPKFRKLDRDPKCWNRSLDAYGRMISWVKDLRDARWSWMPQRLAHVPNPAYGGELLTVAAWDRQSKEW